MRKFLIIFISLMGLVGCSAGKSYSLAQGIEEIDYERLSELKESSDTFLLYIGRSDCGDCNEFYPILEEYMNDNEDRGIYYINIKEMRDNANKEGASQEEKDFYENFYNEFKVSWTPTIEIISNGKIKDSYQYLDEDYIEIEDREKQKEKRQEFIDAFYDFMDSYFEEAIQ